MNISFMKKRVPVASNIALSQKTAAKEASRVALKKALRRGMINDILKKDSKKAKFWLRHDFTKGSTERELLDMTITNNRKRLEQNPFGQAAELTKKIVNSRKRLVELTGIPNAVLENESRNIINYKLKKQRSTRINPTAKEYKEAEEEFANRMLKNIKFPNVKLKENAELALKQHFFLIFERAEQNARNAFNRGM